MTTFFLTDKNGTKHSFTEQQLQTLAAQGKITPNTPLETDTGHKGLAGQIPGLKFDTATAAPSPFGQTVQAAPSAGDCFCTNCGNPLSAQAVAWMSCGAKPVGHKKFCRHCGVALNPEQVVCLKCRAPITISCTDVSWTYDSPPKVPPPYLYILMPLSVLCCLPVGFAACIFFDLCKKDMKAGRYDAAVQKSNIAFIISIIGIVLGLFIGLCLLASS